MKRFQIIIMFWCFLINFSMGQNFTKVLPFPKEFKRPFSLDRTERDAYYNSKSEGVKGEPWLVICDREGLKTFVSPSNRSQLKTLVFKEAYYAVDQTESLIHIVKVLGSVNGNKIPDGATVVDYGWVEKKDMLLWTKCVSDKGTGISKKSMILYTASAAKDIINGSQSKKVPILSGPSEKYPPARDLNIYEFYYVLKEEYNEAQGEDYYLISKQYETSLGFIENDIIGWVPARFQAVWNTRLCFEPNFIQAAYEERKANENLQVVAYGGPNGSQLASRHATSCKMQADFLLSSDPVKPERSELSSDPKRFKGTKMRFPVLNGKDKTVIYTGVIGSINKAGVEIPPEWLIEARKEFDEIARSEKEFDLLFAIEATKDMRSYKAQIKEAIKSLKSTLIGATRVRIGFSIYRNINTINYKDNKVEVKPLSDEIEDQLAWLESVNFYDVDQSDRSIMYLGLYEGIKKAGFSKTSTNIVFVIGKDPDFRYDVSYRDACESVGCNAGKYNAAALSDLIQSFRLNCQFIQLDQERSLLRQDFYDQAINIMLEGAKKIFSTYKGDARLTEGSDNQIRNPSINESRNSNKADVNNSPCFARVYQDPSGPGNAAISKLLKDGFLEIKNRKTEVIQALQKIFDGEDIAGGGRPEDISQGDFSNGIMDIIAMVAANVGKDLTDAEKQDLKKALLSKKISLYTQAYLPRKINCAKHDMFSPVVFFPLEELRLYIEDLRTIGATKNLPQKDKRKALNEALKGIFDKFGAKMSSQEMKNLSLDQLRTMLVGEGFDFTNRQNFVISNILNPQLSDADVEKFIDGVIEIYKKLEDIPNDNQYEYMFPGSGGSRYYWLPVELIF